MDSSIGGSATSQVTVEAVSALASQAAKENFGVASSCQAIARALGADAVEEAQAEAQTEERARAAAWCNVALRWIGISKATAGATLTVSFEPSTCGTSVQAKAACQSRCTGAPCDANANPMSCAGGTLANGFCEGGKLEGGCATDARCDASCDVSVRAFASCAAPDVRVSYAGASDVGEAAKLATTLEHHLPSLLGLAEKCALQAEIAGTLSGNVAAVTDIAPECIARVSKTAAVAIEDVTACAQTTAAVASAFR